MFIASNLLQVRVKWAGESSKWMMLAIIDESSYRLSVNGADNLHLIVPIALVLIPPYACRGINQNIPIILIMYWWVEGDACVEQDNARVTA